MRVLVACEFSGIVREAFRRQGHDAWSADILPAEDNSRFHFYGDLAMPPAQYYVWSGQWDLMVAFPPCTHLASSGARWFKQKGHVQFQAIEFVLALANQNIPKICIENPVGVISTKWRKPDQIIQPWMFGHGETKATCL
jgi:hypothetical protein